MKHSKEKREYRLDSWPYPVSKQDIISRIQGELTGTAGYIEESSVVVLHPVDEPTLTVWFELYTL